VGGATAIVMCRCGGGHHMQSCHLLTPPLVFHVPTHRWLSLLVYSMARLRLRPPPTWQHQIAQAMALHLSSSSSGRRTSTSSSSSSSSRSRQTFSGRDLCLLLWALPGLCLTPPAPLLTAALQASRTSLADLDCSYLTALLVSEGLEARGLRGGGGVRG
jgi:hypothetical protein